MLTILDSASMWLLDAVVYQDDLRLFLVEMIAGDEPEDFQVGDQVISGTRSVEVRDNSRKQVVRFSKPIAWQVVNESYTQWDEYEQRDDTSVLQILNRSKYLDYMNANHGWYSDVTGPAQHYRVWTAEEVVDVIAYNAPSLEPWKSGK